MPPARNGSRDAINYERMKQPTNMTDRNMFCWRLQSAKHAKIKQDFAYTVTTLNPHFYLMQNEAAIWRT